MRSISELDLAVVIPLLASKIQDMTLDLRKLDARLDDLTDDEVEDRCQLQETLQQYDRILDDLRSEYEAALDERISLPSFAELTDRFRVDAA